MSLKIKNVSDSLPRFTIERAIKGMLAESETKRLMRRLKIFNNQNHNLYSTLNSKSWKRIRNVFYF